MSGNETCRVSHVNHEQSTYGVGNCTHAFVIPVARISRTAADDEFRLALVSFLLHVVIIHHSGFGINVVAHGIIEHARSVNL